jgi:O-antigen ligase
MFGENQRLYPARLSQVFLLLWLMAVPFSTGAAEILLGLACAAALAARWLDTTGTSWQGGWGCVVRGGPTTRSVPWLVLAFLLLYLLSVVTAVDPATSVGKLHKLFRYTLFFLLLAVPWDELVWHWSFRALLPVTATLTWFAFEALAEGRSRAQTPNLHYNTLSQVAAMISLLLLAASVYGPRRNRVERSWLLLFALVAAGVLVVTFSRAALLGWISGVVLVFIFRLPKRLVVPLLVVLIAVPVVTVPLLQQKRADLVDIQDPEFTRRYDMWAMARTIISEHPWTGIGPGGMDVVYDQYKTGTLVDDPRTWLHVHNDLLQVALTHGIPASLIWLALMLSLYLALIRRLPRFRRLKGSWSKAGFAGVGAALHLFYMCGFVHDNYNIYIKICLLLFLWGQFVSTDRRLGELPDEVEVERPAGVAA